MDFRRNVSFSGEIPANYQSEQRGSLDDLFSGHSMEESDVNTEWLSIFVEDCLSSSGSCIPLNPQSTTSIAQGTTITTAETNSEAKKKNISMHKPVVSCKAARSKRKRSKFKGTSPLCWFQQYPPLLHQTYWLADSELILPNKSTSQQSTKSEDYGQKSYKEIKQEEEEEEEEGSTGQGRRCSHCLSQRTPQWRAGPEGPKTLCNACGVRYKSGRLLPEYRPAKSPSFVSYKHSNSHKKVLEMRMCSSSFS